VVSWPNGKALDFGSKDCAFESHRDRVLFDFGSIVLDDFMTIPIFLGGNKTCLCKKELSMNVIFKIQDILKKGEKTT
jgi:hypothetical protein